jgi:hypothetical protein
MIVAHGVPDLSAGARARLSVADAKDLSEMSG